MSNVIYEKILNNIFLEDLDIKNVIKILESKILFKNMDLKSAMHCENILKKLQKIIIIQKIN